MLKKIIKRVIAVAAASVLPLALAASPASAAGAAQIEGTEANTYIVQEQTVEDAGGQDFKIKVLWTETYTTDSGNIRVGVKVLSINALGIDLDDSDNPGDGGIDATVKTFQGYADPTRAASLIQSRTFDSVDDPFSFNNANPYNRPTRSKVVITAGVDADGKANSAPATFLQPVVGHEDPGPDGIGVEAS